MSFLKISTGEYPISHEMIRKENPNTSYPEYFTEAEGYLFIEPSEIPPHNPVTQYVKEIYPVNGKQAFGVYDYDEDAVKARRGVSISNAVNSILSGVQVRLDLFASEKGYSGISSAVSYATSSVQDFKSDAEKAASLRDLTWLAAFDIIESVKSGALKASSYSDVEGSLPELKW